MRIKSFGWGCIWVALALCSRPAVAGPLADSVADYSLSQGSNNWYYGFYPASDLSPTGFTMLDSTEGGFWHHSGDWFPSWTSIFPDVMHPNGVNSDGGFEWVVRRWVSPEDLALTISGHLAMVESGGNGVIGSILLDGNAIFSKKLGGADICGVDYSLQAIVSAGSTIDFVVRPRSFDPYYSTRFTAVITAAPEATVPEPSVAALAGVGLLLVWSRRNPSNTNQS